MVNNQTIELTSAAIEASRAEYRSHPFSEARYAAQQRLERRSIYKHLPKGTKIKMMARGGRYFPAVVEAEVIGCRTLFGRVLVMVRFGAVDKNGPKQVAATYDILDLVERIEEVA